MPGLLLVARVRQKATSTPAPAPPGRAARFPERFLPPTLWKLPSISILLSKVWTKPQYLVSSSTVARRTAWWGAPRRSSAAPALLWVR